MDWDKALGRLAIVVPVLHVVVCTFFLAGYSWGFGGGVSKLFDTSDYFTATIENLIKIYTVALAIPLMTLVYRHRSGHPYAIDTVHSEEDPLKRDIMMSRMLLIRKLIFYISWILVFLILFAFIIQVKFDLYRSYYVTSQVIILALTFPYWHLCRNIKFYGFWAELAWLLVGFAFATLAMGADSGFKDRRYPYSIVSQDSFSCNNNSVIFRAGENFIAVEQLGKRIALNKDCDLKFEFSEFPPITEKSIYEVIVDHFGKH